jgi:hypothetical protein
MKKDGLVRALFLLKYDDTAKVMTGFSWSSLARTWNERLADGVQFVNRNMIFLGD